MSEQEETNEIKLPYPRDWQIAADWDPNDHLMELRGRDYLNVQNRMIWFLKHQRAMIASGIACFPYVVRTELVDHDPQKQWAQFKTYVRDVLGNEATMYGSEDKQGFGDYLEKASTKSLGRALLMLGYGTAFADEMDEGERVVDSPVERKRTAPTTPTTPTTTPTPPKTTPPSSRAPQAASTASSSQSRASAPVPNGPTTRSGAVSANTRKKLREWAEKHTDFMREMKTQRFPTMTKSLADELTEQEALALLLELPTLLQTWQSKTPRQSRPARSQLLPIGERASAQPAQGATGRD